PTTFGLGNRRRGRRSWQSWTARRRESGRRNPIRRSRPKNSRTREKGRKSLQIAGSGGTAENGWKRGYRTALSIAEVFVLLTVSHSTCSFGRTKRARLAEREGFVRLRARRY